MTEQDNINKPKKLTLSGKLSLSKPLDKSTTPKTVVNSGATIVEVKKSKLSLQARLTNVTATIEQQPASDQEANDTVTKRLHILKTARENLKSQEDDFKHTSLSKLAAMNQPENTSKQVKQDKETNDQSSLEKSGVTSQPVIPLKTTTPVFGEDEDALNKKKALENKTPGFKPKLEDSRKINKAKIFHMLDEDENARSAKTRSYASLQRAREKAKKRLSNKQEKLYREVIIPEKIIVSELANRMSERSSDVIRELMKLGIIANLTQELDADTAEIIATTLGHTVKRVQESDIENVITATIDNPEDLQTRGPVVTVMGHVDHGKTSLLDALKTTNIVAKEIGGITQHIGAYKVIFEDKMITFIDTPGHEAFTAMRTRGAAITDIVVLVVAADDGIKPQTIEAINHAKSAKVPIIVAINKIDKPDINIEKIKNELLSYELISEELGGDTIFVPISATKKINLDKLLEAILLLAEMEDLKANYKAAASGVVIESRIDKAQGVIATILVQRGILKIGDLIIAGTSYGRIKKMKDDKAIEVRSACPVDPVEIYGLDTNPSAGDKFDFIQTEKQARDITDYRKRLIKDKKNLSRKPVSLEDLLNQANNNPIKELRLLIKADVQGSIEAIEASLLKILSKEVQIKIIHSAVGNINDSDLALAEATGTIIIGFNTKINPSTEAANSKNKVDIRYYSIIYNLIDDIKELVSGMLTPVIREQYIGSAEVKQVFDITKAGKIAGSYVTKGVIKRGAKGKLLRDKVVLHEGKIKTLKRFKEDVKEVNENFECGIAFENYEGVEVGDVIEAYEIIEEKQKLL